MSYSIYSNLEIFVMNICNSKTKYKISVRAVTELRGTKSANNSMKLST